METYSPVRGMIICQNDTGDYVSKADFDALREERNEAWKKRNAAFEEVERLQEERDKLRRELLSEDCPCGEIAQERDEAERLLRLSCEIVCGVHPEDTTLEGLRKGRSPELADISLAIESACIRLRGERDLATKGAGEWREKFDTLLRLAGALAGAGAMMREHFTDGCDESKTWDEALAAYLKEAKPERCECGAGAEACKQNRAKFGVHLESGCGD